MDRVCQSNMVFTCTHKRTLVNTLVLKEKKQIRHKHCLYALVKADSQSDQIAFKFLQFDAILYNVRSQFHERKIYLWALV